MKPITREWVEKAEEDYRVARREQSAKPPAYNAVCFHAQQCVEKLMKALLIHLAVPPPRTHDLQALAKLLAPVRPDWSGRAEDLRFLTRASVEFRYPGEQAGQAEAQQAYEIAAQLREKLRALLGLAP